MPSDFIIISLFSHLFILLIMMIIRDGDMMVGDGKQNHEA